MIATVLLMPEPGDPMGLLTLGEGGARPPRAWRCPCGRWMGWFWSVCSTCDGAHTSGNPSALALAWDGKPIPEGTDRLRRAWMEWDNHHRVWMEVDTFASCVQMAKAAVMWGECSAIVLDEGGRVVVTPDWDRLCKEET